MELENLPVGKKIVLFDGVCNLCNRTVQYIIKHDKNDIFRFAALQSEIGQKILKHIGIDQKNIDSVVLYEPGVAYYYKSAAAIEIARYTGGFLSMATIFRILPKSLLDPIYDSVARSRYRKYGKMENCMIPTPEIQAKFL